MRRRNPQRVTGILPVWLKEHRQDACATLAVVGFLMGCTPTLANPANDLMRQGAEAYKTGNLDEAATAFHEALALAEEDESLDPAAARLNLGTTLARGGQFEPAADELAEALKTDDLNLQAKAQYNLGHVRYREADSLVEQQDLQNAKTKIDQSIGHFQDALRLDPADLQTKKNFELSHLKKKQIEALIEQQPPQEQQQNQDQENEDQQEQEQEQNQDQSQQQDQQQDQQQEQQDPPQDDPQPPEDTPPEPGEDGQEQQDPPPEPPPEQMTEEEAEMLLEAMKEEEQQQREQYRIRLGRPQPVDKDW